MVSTVAAQSVVLVVLARLLGPESFGLIGQAMIFVGFAQILSEIGMAEAIVQRRELNEDHYRTAFTLSVAAGGLLSVSVWMGAEVLAGVFGEAELGPLLRILSVAFFFSSVGTTRMGVLQRNLDFRSKYWVAVVPYIAGYAPVGITLAYLDFGPWALAYAILVERCLSMILLFVLTEHPRNPGFSLREAKDLLGFGTGYSINTIVWYFTRNTDLFVVGRWMGPAALGFYSWASSLIKAPVMASTILVDVLFPAYAEIQDEPERLKTAFMRSVSVAALIAYPLLAGMFLVAPELVRGVFGARWEPTVGVLQIQCVGALVWCINSLSEAAVRAKGAVFALMSRRLLFSVVLFAGAFFGVLWGIEGVASGVVGALLVWYLLLSHLTLRLVDGSWKDLLLAQSSGLMLATIVAAVAYGMTALLRSRGYPDLVILGSTIICCGLAVAATAILVPKTKLSDGPLWARHKVEVLWDQRFGG